jgi:acyl carrier protein
MVDLEKIIPEATLESLNLQSIDIVMILSGIEEKFSTYIPVDNELTQAKNVEEFINILLRHIHTEKTS